MNSIMKCILFAAITVCYWSSPLAIAGGVETRCALLSEQAREDLNDTFSTYFSQKNTSIVALIGFKELEVVEKYRDKLKDCYSGLSLEEEDLLGIDFFDAYLKADALVFKLKFVLTQSAEGDPIAKRLDHEFILEDYNELMTVLLPR